MNTRISTSDASFSHVLGLFAKEPRPGLVKTRLAAEVSDEWAARVARAFLLDAVDRFGGIDAHRVLAFTPQTAGAFFAEIAQGRFALLPQREGDLGQRMATFIAEHLRTGAESVVLVGADSPTLGATFVEQAFRELERVDVVVGPATDGGYYLIGCARRLPPIFDGIDWGSSRVLGATVKRLTDSEWRFALLPPWYDVDTLDDWRMLQGHVAALRQAGIDPGVQHTERLLQSPLP